MFSLLGRNSKRKSSNRHGWESENNHKTWRIRNSPININDEYILYSTDMNVGEAGIVLYDIKTNKFDITKYPSNISPEYHSYCRYKNDIYIINTDGSIIIYNLNKRNFKIIDDIKNKQSIGRYSSCINIEGTDIIHIFGGLDNQHHLLYSITHNKYTIQTDFGVKLENPSIIHLKSQNKLIMFCGYASKSFFIGSIINDIVINWEISKILNIPNKLRDCGTLTTLLYKKYVLIFGGTLSDKQYSNNIHAINIENGEIIKLNNMQCPSKDIYHVILINNKIHLFGIWNNVKHYSLPINIIEDILPKYVEIEEKKENNELNELKKEIEIKNKIIMELKKENKELKFKLTQYEQKLDDNKLDETQYKKWNANMICLWINKIENGLFKDYKNKLFENLIEDGIEGNDLFDINNHEQWKGYGINKFGHRKILMENVKMLINIDQNDELINDEGKQTQYVDR
eukprot:242592_1